MSRMTTGEGGYFAAAEAWRDDPNDGLKREAIYATPATLIQCSNI